VLGNNDLRFTANSYSYSLFYFFIMGTELIKLFGPGYILQHFDYEKLEEMSGVTRTHLVEKKPKRSIAIGIAKKI